jgi:predicted porin
MIKKLIPAAVLLSLFGAAQAQVTVYGLIDASYGKNEIGVGTETKATFHSGGDNGSSQGNSTTKIGLKGSSEVAKGIKANFKLESGGINSDGSVNSNGNFFDRAAWAGLSGNFGEVRLGRQDNVPFQTMVDFDFNGAANAASAQMNSLATPWSLNGRQSRSLQYIAPAMGGLSIQAGFVPEGEAATSKAVYSVGLKYTAGKLVVAAAGQTASTTTNSSFSSVAGSYDFGVAKVMASYADGGEGFKGTSVGIVAPVAGFNVGMTYAKNSDATAAAATEVFVNREIYKNTYAYFDYGNLDKANVYFAKGNAYALGVIFTF